jgi:hypothetical protein
MFLSYVFIGSSWGAFYWTWTIKITLNILQNLCQKHTWIMFVCCLRKWSKFLNVPFSDHLSDGHPVVRIHPVGFTTTNGFLHPLLSGQTPIESNGTYLGALETNYTCYFLVLHPVARNITILNESTTFRNQIMCVHFIILHCTTCFGLQAGHHHVLSDNIIIL